MTGSPLVPLFHVGIDRDVQNGARRERTPTDTISWVDVPTTDKPRKSGLGAPLRTPQAEISYGLDCQDISPSIESPENVV